MDTLVGMGAVTVYASSVLASFVLPAGSGWAPSFHEPVMLLAVVQLGRCVRLACK